MVNIPKTDKKHCLKCNAHKTMKVSIYKKSKDNPNRQGNRRYKKKQKGCHGQTKPILQRKAKTTKKTVLKFECSGCKSVIQSVRARAKHIELGAAKKVKGQALIY